MADLIIAGVLVVLIGAAVLYIRKEKKKGRKCIGCPSAGCCQSNKCAGETIGKKKM